VKATNFAARIGQFLAIVFVFLGFYSNFWLVFIGIFIFLGAGGEANYERTKSMLAHYRVRDVLMRRFTMLAPDETLGTAVKSLLDGPDQEFLIGTNDMVQGVLTRKAIIEGLSELGKDVRLSDVMRKDFMVLEPDMELQEVLRKMMTDGYSISPVLDDKKLVGIVNLDNINELIMVNRAMTNKAKI
jgi:predicted transcriptional regulator